MQNESMEFAQYRHMDVKTKLKLIRQAKQDEKWRQQNPQGECRFLEQDFMTFEVFQGKQKLSLKTYRHYKSKDMSGAIGLIVMFHGLNSHMGHGSHLAQTFAQSGFITVGFDYRGFGQSPGERGFVSSLEGHLFDCLDFTKRVKKLYPQIPTFALGLSMGGMTVYYLSLRNKDLFRGVVMMAPSIKNVVNGYMVSLVRGISRVFYRKFRIPFKQPKGQATRNPQITEDVFSDPFAYTSKPCVKTVKMLIDTMDKTPKTFAEYEASFVIIQGGLDKLVHPDGAFQLYDKCKSKDKTIWFYQQMWHDIWHEQQIHQIMKKTASWLLQRVPEDSIVREEAQAITAKNKQESSQTGEKLVFRVDDLDTHAEISKVRRTIHETVDDDSKDFKDSKDSKNLDQKQ